MDECYTRTALCEIFREIFEAIKPGASGTWLVERDEGIFNAIETLTPTQASTVLPGHFASIGSHVRHLNYYLTLFNANHRGESQKVDWAGSWEIDSFSDEEWKALGGAVRKEFDEAYAWYQNDSAKDQEDAVYAVSNIAHAAYHLGAIRALTLLV